jgi:hypothetical protein
MGSLNGMMLRGAVTTCLALNVVLSAPAVAEVTTERPGSILIFPRVLFDSAGLQTGEPVDTIIQISNRSNNPVYAHCYYVNAAPANPFFPPGVLNPPVWQEVDFEIMLTKQQPTHWVVGSGRRDDPRDPACTKYFRDCSGAGFDPGLVPPVADPFTGELKCVEVDSPGGAPLNGNNLKGEATLVTPAGDASKYNAIGVIGLNSSLNSNNGDATLCLGGSGSAPCRTAEYNACPQTLILNHFAENASNPVIDLLQPFEGSFVTTELTLVPCSQDFENQLPVSVVVQFKLINEFEELFSASTTVTCWANFRLNDVARVFDVGFLGSRFVQTRMQPATEEESGILGVAEEFHVKRGVVDSVGRAALNLHMEGERRNGDIIRLIDNGRTTEER